MRNTINPYPLYNFIALYGEKARQEQHDCTITVIRGDFRTVGVFEPGDYDSLAGIQRKEREKRNLENCNQFGERLQVSGRVPLHVTECNPALSGMPP